MLISFKVENFRSYKEENDLVLTSTSKIHLFPEHVHPVGAVKLLKFIGIYGDNASGKSNLLKAVLLLKSLVFPTQPIDLDFAFKENEGKPTTLEILFSTEGSVYQYGVRLLKQTSPFPSLRIVDEYLNLIGNKEEHSKEIFSLKNGINPVLLSAKDKDVFSLFWQGYQQLSTPLANRLFLNYINDRDKVVPGSLLSNHLARVFNYIKDNLVVIGANTMNMAYIKGDYMATIMTYVKEFDPSIEDIQLERIPNDDLNRVLPAPVLNQIEAQLFSLSDEIITLNFNNDSFFFLSKDAENNIKCETLKLKHRYIRSWFKFADESEGTKKFIVLMSYFSNKNQTKTFFVDELERSMHPSSSQYILDFFNHETLGLETQFVFTTHNPSFMKSALRRDEIYFVEKDLYGDSALYPLTDFSTRTDSDLVGMFLHGKFRKIPEQGRKVFGDGPAAY
jgi:AAA15 family ATPase/GTPase